MSEIVPPSPNGTPPPDTPASLDQLAALFGRLTPQFRRWLGDRIPPSLRGRLDPDDLITRTWLRIQKRYPRLLARHGHAPPDLGRWLWRKLKDCWLDERQRQQRTCRDHRRERVLPENSSGQAGPDVADSATSPSSLLAWDENRRQVEAVLQQLTAEERQVLEARWWNDLTWNELARRLGLSPEASRQRYSRAFRRFSQRREQGGMP